MSVMSINLDPDKNPLLKSISTCNAHVSVQDMLATLHDNKWNGALSNRVIDGFIFGYEISKLINFIKSYYPSIKAMGAGDKRWLDEGGWMYHGAYLYYDDCPITVGRRMSATSPATAAGPGACVGGSASASGASTTAAASIEPVASTGPGVPCT